jgi:hypothetical protein
VVFGRLDFHDRQPCPKPHWLPSPRRGGRSRIALARLADAKTLNVTQTPEYFINGHPMPSFGCEQLHTLVEEELAATSKAKAK